MASQYYKYVFILGKGIKSVDNRQQLYNEFLITILYRLEFRTFNYVEIIKFWYTEKIILILIVI